MVGNEKSKIPELTVRNTTETFLCHSQSPSFADPRSPETSAGQSTFVSLVIRDVQKRQKPVFIDEHDEPERKKTKSNGNVITTKDIDNRIEIAEYPRELSKILCSSLNIHEMYRALRVSASAIPCPKPLVLPEKDLQLKDVAVGVPNKCSIDDRKKVILELFSRRFGLKLCSETLHLGVALLDQCLELMLVGSDALVDLAAVTMVIASKVEEINCITIRDVIENNLVTNKTIKMIGLLERVVLTSLKFEVTVPTPLTFATYLLVYVSASPIKISLTNYLLELSVLYIHNRLYPSDVVAHAATCLASAIDCDPKLSSLKALQDAEFKLHKFSGIDMASSRSRELMRTLVDLFLDAPEENHTIYREYMTQRRHSVALRPIDVSLLKALKIETA